MSEDKFERISKVARELNIGAGRIVEFLQSKGHVVENNPNAKLSSEMVVLLRKEFASSYVEKQEASSVTIGKKHSDVVIESQNQSLQGMKKEEDSEIMIKGVNTDSRKSSGSSGKEEPADSRVKLEGPKILGKIDLSGQKPAAPVPPVAAPVPSAPVSKPATPVAVPVAETKAVAPEPVVEVEKPAPVVESAPSPSSSPSKQEVNESPVVEVTAEKTPVLPEPPAIQETTPVVQVSEEIPAPAVVVEKIQVVPEVVIPVEAGGSVIKAEAETLKGLTVLGKIDLSSFSNDPKKNQQHNRNDQADKKKRKRIKVEAKPNPGQPGTPGTGQGTPQGQGQGGGGNRFNQGQNKGGNPRFNQNRGTAPNPNDPKPEVSDKQIQEQIKNTLARLSGGQSGKGGVNRAKYRKEKRTAHSEAMEERMLQEQEESKTLQVTEFISANDMASLMDVSVNEVIKVCMQMGMFISINQRLDAEAITIIADEFGYAVKFISAEDEVQATDPDQEVDEPENLVHRAPIVTIMGHVDHGKTSLLDYIRKTNVTASEAGGITQHIGAYDVKTESGKRITFLDTPGHEAFTAMRARGAKVTDVVIIVVAADDAVMPQTKEAINHAQNAGVPIVIAINKVDKPNSNPEKIKEELAQINILVEDWGGKYQCEHISAKKGTGIQSLLEKVLLEAELLDLKANPNRNASGTVIESMLDKGKGYVTTLLVQTGTLRVGDIILAGAFYGKVKAMNDHLGVRLKEAGPSKPAQVLGLPGAPQAGDKVVVMDSEKEAREIANKREQILREQAIRTKKHITLDEIGRRLAIGNFKQLNIIVKGDVDGSVEALSDSLLKLSGDQVQVSIIHKGVGQISESDVLLASASDAIIVGFQVRPSMSARKIAEQEQIEIRLYSIIYAAINEVKDAIEGMLEPEKEEVITSNVEVREVFKISKLGTIAGCYVTDGAIKRNSQIRLVRDGIVVYSGKLGSLKRFREDMSEVKAGFECGLSIDGFNDIQLGDIIESYEEREVKKKLV